MKCYRNELKWHILLLSGCLFCAHFSAQTLLSQLRWQNCYNNTADTALERQLFSELDTLEWWYPETDAERELLLKNVQSEFIYRRCVDGGYGDPGFESEPQFYGTKYIVTYAQAPTNSEYSTTNYYRVAPTDHIIDSLYRFHHTMDSLKPNKTSYSSSDSIILTFTRHGHHFENESPYLFHAGDPYYYGEGRSCIVTDTSKLKLFERMNGGYFRMKSADSFVVPAVDFSPGTYRLLIVRNGPFVCCRYSVVFLKCDGKDQQVLMNEKFAGMDEYWYCDPIVISN